MKIKLDQFDTSLIMLDENADEIYNLDYSLVETKDI